MFQPLQSASLAERLRLFKSLCERRLGIAGAGTKDPTAPGRDVIIRLADGKTVKGSAGVTTPLQIAQNQRSEH